MKQTLSPTFDDYKKSFPTEKIFSVFYKIIQSDLFTPVSLMMHIHENFDHCFLFESVEGGEKLGRYSFIGFDAALTWTVNDSAVLLDKKPQSATPVQSFQNVLNFCDVDYDTEKLPPGIAGLYGYFGFEMMQHFEDIQLRADKDGLDNDMAAFFLPRFMIVFDHVKNIAYLLCHHQKDKTKTVLENYQDAAEKFTIFDSILMQSATPENLIFPVNKKTEDIDFKSNISKETFLKNIDIAKNYIRAGDAFQIVLSQRFEMDFASCPFRFYRELRRVNPSPFLFFMRLNDLFLVGSSPEILVRVRDDIVTLRPIAGTRKRGKTKEADAALAQELLNDPKECSEHLMLLDLGRNDVGRICQTGTVNVTDKFFVEYYSHVMHIVSNVEGKLQKDKTALDALRCGFPAGTVSGAPKIRAVEIIDSLEPTTRGVYAGCIGYIDGKNQMDTCIALRTAIIKNNKIYVQSGAGIVYDSDPESEYQETVNKAKALLVAAANLS